MGEKFERHKQAWTSDEVQKLHTLAKKGMPLRAIAKALTEAHGGRIAVGSGGPGCGTTFTVSIPAGPAAMRSPGRTTAS